MIEISGLTKHFGPLVAVEGVTFSVARGDVLGFLGPNGAGKSTTMKMLTGFLPPTAGTAVVGGFDVVANPIEVKKRIGYLPEGAPAYSDMNPAQLLDFAASVRGISGNEKRAAIDKAVAATQLAGVLAQPIETLSKGFKHRVGFAAAILHDPEILILDEPTDGLDPNQKHDLRQLISDMAAEKAIIISTHILEEVEAICTRAIIIARGRLVADDTPAEFLARSEYHNALVLRLASNQVEDVKAKIGGLSGIARIEESTPHDGVAELVVVPEKNRAILDEASALIRAHNLPVDEISVERGRLDEVFRHITADN